MSNADMFGIAGRKALVVGGGLGIGHETALLLTRAGCSVAVADIDLARAEKVCAEIAEMGGRAVPLTGDVTRRATAEGVVRDAAAALGGLDIVTNIVGSAAYASIDDIDDELWDQQQAINVRHQLNVARAAAQLMIADGAPGAIAVVASISGIYGAPLHGAYGAAKAALMSLVRTMSQEWGPKGIRVNAVAPDGIATPRMVASFAARGSDMSHLARDTSLGRAGQPIDIANALLFLVSEMAAFITGQTLIVDGGVHAQLPHKMDTWED